MDYTALYNLQECIELCRQLEHRIQEHREEAARAMSGEVFEQYAELTVRIGNQVEDLEAELRKLHNKKSVM